MELNRRQIIVIVVAVGLILAAVLGGWYLSRRPVTVPSPVATEQTSTPTNVTTPPTPQPIAESTEAEVSALRLARLVAERFGTFSSQGRFESVGEIVPLATDRFRQWLETSYLPDLRAKHPASSYTGQTTKVLSAELSASSETKATAVLQVQQTSTSTGANQVRYTSMTIDMVYTANGWLVDSIK